MAFSYFSKVGDEASSWMKSGSFSLSEYLSDVAWGGSQSLFWSVSSFQSFQLGIFPCFLAFLVTALLCGGGDCCSEFGLYTLQIGCLPRFLITTSCDFERHASDDAYFPDALRRIVAHKAAANGNLKCLQFLTDRALWTAYASDNEQGNLSMQLLATVTFTWCDFFTTGRSPIKSFILVHPTDGGITIPLWIVSVCLV